MFFTEYIKSSIWHFLSFYRIANWIDCLGQILLIQTTDFIAVEATWKACTWCGGVEEVLRLKISPCQYKPTDPVLAAPLKASKRVECALHRVRPMARARPFSVEGRESPARGTRPRSRTLSQGVQIGGPPSWVTILGYSEA